ncbi:MAG: outer membrane beta-barrel protein [Vicinamibacteria bacterium]|nr:outer membrane beta-barrel protein [Vicinamibacteria bacterium]
MKVMGRLTSCAATLVLGAMILSATPVEAQEGKLGLYAGYAFLKIDEGNLHGVRLSPELRVNGFAALVGDVSWEKGTSTTITTYLGGLRLKRGMGSVSLFAHALAGVVRDSASVSPFGGITISSATSGLGLDGGGGFEFKAGKSLKLRLGADYLRRKIDTDGGSKINANDIRATVGFVF